MTRLSPAKLVAILGLIVLALVTGCGTASPTPTAAQPAAAPAAAQPAAPQPAAAPTTAPATAAAPPAPAPAAAKPTATPAAAQPSGELKIAVGSFGNGILDPMTAAGDDMATLGGPLYESLVGKNGIELAPSIAEKWQMDPDGKSWTFYIRKGIKFHNGDEVTSKDVKFSLDRFIAKDAFYSYLRDIVERIEVVDEYTVRVFGKGPQAYLPLQLSPVQAPTLGLIIPKGYFEKNGLEYFKNNPIGTGPFKLTGYKALDSAQYQAVTGHWRQTPSFSKIDLALVPDEATRVSMLRSGGTDITDVGPDSAADLASKGFALEQVSTQIATIVLQGSGDPRAANMPIGNLKVRQALSLAINRDEINKTFFNGKGDITSVGFLTASTLDIDADYWKGYAKQAYRFDPDEAKRLLAEAGYANGFTVKFYSYPMAGGGYLPKLAEIVAGYWAKIGVRAEIAPIDIGAFNKIRSTAKSPDAIGSISTYRNTLGPGVLKQLTSAYHSGGSFAPFGTSRKDIDQMIVEIGGELDTTKRRTLVANTLKVVTDSYTIIKLAEVPMYYALGPKVAAGWANNPTYYTIGDAVLAKRK